MTRVTWKSVLSHKECSWSTWLHEATVQQWAMLRSIPRFLVTRIPEVLRELFSRIEEAAISCCRVGYHLSKFLGVMVAWLATLALPLILYPGLITFIWLVLAGWGSGWGYLRHQKRAAAARAMEVANA